VIDLFRRPTLWLLALLLTVGCDLQHGVKTDAPADADPSAEQEGSIAVFFSQVADKPDRNRDNPNNIAKACARALGAARRTLDVCCHEIDNRAVVEAILEAHFRGVKVRVITETDYIDELGPQAFLEAGVPVVSDKRSALMHQKFAVIDGVAVWTGSFNFTENCANKNNNNGLFIRSPKVAENYSAWFDWFWNEGRKSKRRKTEPSPNPAVKLLDGSVVETRLTTADDMEQLALQIIREARQSVKFLAFSFTHKDIAAAMRERARKGVKIYGIFEQRNLTTSRYNDLADEPNVVVMPDGNPYQMHHKVIIVDDAVILAGSFNFSENASKSNDENYVVISGNPTVARQFVEEFHRVYKTAHQKIAQAETRVRR
jgi:phosphatidylserine/phosphatidylglycerophosphate/cardiolipin synthase-like enzyme